MNTDKAIDRVRKLLSLAEGGSEHEAAQAAARAAELIEEYQLTEAQLAIDEMRDWKPEPINTGYALPYKSGGARKRSAWRSTIVGAVARSYGCKMYWTGPEIKLYGRESSVQATDYTSRYLWAEVENLCEREAKLEGASGKAWHNAFKLGAASRIAVRLAEETAARKRDARQSAILENFGTPVPDIFEDEPEDEPSDGPTTVEVTVESSDGPTTALAVVERDQAQVETEYKSYSEKWKKASPMGTYSSRSGLEAGREAGNRISLGGGRAGLPAGRGVFKS